MIASVVASERARAQTVYSNMYGVVDLYMGTWYG